MSNIVPNDWRFLPLTDVIEVKHGFQFREEHFADYGMPIVKIGNLTYGSNVNMKSYSMVPRERFDNYESFRLQLGDVLMALTGATLGKVSLFNFKPLSLQNYRVGNFLPKSISTITKDFIFWVLQSEFVQAKIEDMVNQAAQPNIGKADLESMFIPVPPVAEQVKISQALTSINRVIEKTQAQIDKLKDLKTAMMQELLTNGVGTKPASADTALNNSTASQESYIPHTEFKDSPVGRIPKSWEVVELDQITKVIDCKHATPKYFSDGYPVVKPGNIREGNLNVDACAFTDRAGFDNLNENHTPRVGDIIYSRNQTYGIGAYVDRNVEFCIGQDVCIIHPLSCDSKFIYYVLNSPVVRHQVEFLAAGSTFKRINLGAIRKLKMLQPPIKEQLKIAEIFESMDKKIIITSAKLKALQNTKKALMQDLLTGKVRVKLEAS
jgi:type I restriction enzyme S subunit